MATELDVLGVDVYGDLYPDLYTSSYGYGADFVSAPPVVGQPLTLPAVFWTIDGQPITIRDWDCNSVANGGFDQMRGEAALTDWQEILIPPQQGSIVRAFQDGGNTVWYGRLSGPPQARQGIVKLAAQGEKVRAEKLSGPLLYQYRGYDDWQESHTEPFNLSGGTLIDGRIRKTDLYWELNKDEVYPATGDDSRYQFALWVPNVPGGITRVAANIRKSLNTANAEFQLRRLTGPDGTVTTVATYSLDSGGPTSFDTAISTPEDAVILSLQTLAHTPTQKRVFRLDSIRVNGIASGDTFAASDVVEDVAGRVGFDSLGVAGTSTNVLPLYWQQGTGADLLDYMATLEDAYWRVVEPRPGGVDPLIEFTRYDSARTWVVKQERGASLDLVPLELFNRTTVRYPSLNGTTLSVTVFADIDPLAASGITNVFDEFELTDPQPDSVLAEQAATVLMARYGSQRYAGNIEAVQVEAADGGTGTVYDVRAGDLITVSDFDNGQSLTLRAVDVGYSAQGIRITTDAMTSFATLVARLGRPLQRGSGQGIPLRKA